MNSGTKTSIEQGLADALAGKTPSLQSDGQWFGPGKPLAPMANEAARGRTFDFPFAVNQTISRPKANEGVSMQDLRQLADAYDLLRLVIETRKDQICKLEWNILNEEGDETPKSKEIKKFLQSPDKEHDWEIWLRALLEDLFVLDAATIYPQMTRGGQVYSLDLVDGATVKRVLDARGKTPVPPDPAYQQILKGMPAVDYTREELLYLPRNVRTNRVYGYSPVEQVVMTVNIALRRQMHQLEYYTQGTIPDALIGVPSEWNPDQIAQMQAYWDALMEGDTAARRHARFVPGGTSIQQTKEPVIKDMYDEWLARVICFAFSVSPQGLVAQMNRATSETAVQQSNKEGLQPVMAWIKSVINRVIRECFKAEGLMFDWVPEEESDQLIQSQIDISYVNAGIMKVNEVRERLGLEALDDDDADEEKPKKDSKANQDDTEDEEDAKPSQKDTLSTEKVEKSEIHIHLPEGLVKNETFVDVPSPIVHVHK